MTQPTSFPIWKTLTLGKYKTVAELVAALQERGTVITPTAELFLNDDRMKLYPNVQEIHLVAVSAKDLGFTEGADYTTIWKKAQEFGLGFCPQEIGPLLCFEPDLVSGFEMFNIAAQFFNVGTDTDPQPYIFEIMFGLDPQGSISAIEPSMDYLDIPKFVFAVLKNE